jgi:hypothetical protein
VEVGGPGAVGSLRGAGLDEVGHGHRPIGQSAYGGVRPDEGRTRSRNAVSQPLLGSKRSWTLWRSPFARRPGSRSSGSTKIPDGCASFASIGSVGPCAGNKRAAPCSLAVASVRADTANFRSDPPTKGRVLAVFAALGSALGIPSASVLVGDYFWGHLRNEPSPPIHKVHVLVIQVKRTYIMVGSSAVILRCGLPPLAPHEVRSRLSSMAARAAGRMIRMSKTEMVRAYAESLLEQVVGTDKVKPDNDGDYPVRYQSALYYVRIDPGRRDDPVVQVFAAAVDKVEPGPPLYEALNDINTQLRFARAFWVRGQVLIEAEMPGMSRSALSSDDNSGQCSPTTSTPYPTPPYRSCPCSWSA